MRYEKPALTFDQQADRLLDRGLLADREELIRRLQAVSYYRLSGYLYPFRNPDTDRFREGTTLATVWDRYCFDRRLRVVLLDAIERTEVSVRTKLIYRFSHAHGPFGHLDDANLPRLKIDDYLEWRLALQEETRRSKEAFKEHFFKKYDEHRNLPLWMVAELMTMGSLLTFFNGVSAELKRTVAGEYGFPDELLLSWLRTLNAARNLCAHHARLWNRTLGYPALLPSKNKFPEWHGEHKLPNNKCAVLLMICRCLLRMISPTSLWHERVERLLTITPLSLCLKWAFHQTGEFTPYGRVNFRREPPCYKESSTMEIRIQQKRDGQGKNPRGRRRGRPALVVFITSHTRNTVSSSNHESRYQSHPAASPPVQLRRTLHPGTWLGLV